MQNLAKQQVASALSQVQSQLVVSTRDVSKVYEEDGLRVPALRNITMNVSAQRFTMIVGASGSGKTTLLNLFGCIDNPSGGEVEVCGQKIAALSDDALAAFRARSVGFIFQNFSLFPVLSVYENVEYPLLLTGVPAAERRQRTLAMLEAVGLADKLTQRPNQLSGGQKQRVAVARALVKKPSLILADEPTANLDTRTGAELIALMREMQRRQGVSFIFSTHDPQLMSHAEETFVIRDGALVEHSQETH